ncbi:hypothetical protein FGG08_001414 [Glutinoglossum americanum]|uniref:Uncharacterized protein n=1 Tax=Glutinoglossum americanum TaxID=1670608 RepID=A0A9P8L5D3_9PEZI|nr:hypothetical protein FGG08_001414 [Glutinoglossum americanum]
MAPTPPISFAPLPKYPVRYSEWCAAIREVKSLYFERQYKQCAARCTELLEEGKPPRCRIHPIHATVLSFYAASSLEVLAQPLSSFSNTKLPLLNSARSFYLAAALFLSTESPPLSPSPSSSTSSGASIGFDSTSPCSSPASSATTSYYLSDERQEEEEDLTDARAFAASKARIAAKRKEKVVRFSPSTSFPPNISPLNSPSTTDDYFRTRAQLRLQAHSTDMARKLELHLATVETLIAKAEEEKRANRFSITFKEREERKAKRKEWIARRGWRNEEREEMDADSV